jgi:hypothetical protein
MLSRHTLMAAALLLASSAVAKGPKLKPKELVDRHLSALGPAEAREAVKTRFCQGEVRYQVIQGGAGGLTGAAGLVSEGHKTLLGMKFGHPDYAGERISYDGVEAFVGTIKSGERSELGRFLYQHPVIQREGLLGGSLSTAWPLLELKQRDPRLKLRGLRKAGDRELLLLTYRPRKGAQDLEIKLYFDPESYLHVCTSYELLLPAPMGAHPDFSSRMQEDRWLLEELFSDFREVDGLLLPRQYSLSLTVQTRTQSTLTRWDMALGGLVHNEAIDPALFAAPEPRLPGADPTPTPRLPGTPPEPASRSAGPDSRTQNFHLE